MTNGKGLRQVKRAGRIEVSAAMAVGGLGCPSRILSETRQIPICPNREKSYISSRNGIGIWNRRPVACGAEAGFGSLNQMDTTDLEVLHE